ncbi:MAG: HAD family phosphatase [Tindallia sp. MSAO_Bac2]|nr:MAG: HAD family phosphatase [Tindallia sp. MSAO_Bac2]
MKYKLLATDMDGTLLDDRKSLSNKNIMALKKAYENGMEVVLCTGRPFHTVEPYLNQIKLPCWLITNNGAVIRNPQKDILYTHYISRNSLNQVLNILSEKPVLYFHGSAEEHTYIKSRWSRLGNLYRFERKSKKNRFVSLRRAVIESWFSSAYQVVDFRKFVEEGYQLTNLIVISSNMKQLECKRRQLKKVPDIYVTRSGNDNMEILDRNATKGNALKKLAGDLGINREKIVAIGDHDNDLSMLKYAGTAIAVENATQSLKESADLVVCTNNNDALHCTLAAINMSELRKV